VRADHEHHATGIIECDGRERCDCVRVRGRDAPRIIRRIISSDGRRSSGSIAASWFDADEAFAPVVDGVEAIDPAAPGDA
jgi:hypothetical protein